MKFLKIIFSPIYYAMAGFSFTISSLQFFLCEAVIKIVNIKNKLITNFFNWFTSFLFYFNIYYWLAITNTVFNLSKSTAVSTVAYLSVKFCVFVTFVTVPTCIPLG